ncbi:hypothetical protein [Stenotrophomonas maltophilia]|uniref:hypothetical protein n=1 Tax=Stenotrophomonas maltophilia TaxID=40324 RepID=UPI0012FE3F4F|nr:hypothetical protein [Stenotrophomonas maltophilia]
MAGSNNYNPRTNEYRNVGAGLVGTAGKVAANAFLGPVLGRVVGKGIDRLVDRFGAPGFPQMQKLPVERSPLSVDSAITAPSPLAVSNLGLGAERPGGNWYGYTGGPGSMGSFGNTQFGNGMASIGQWNPQSIWGQQVAAPAGSNLDLGNNVGGFIGGGGSGSGGSMGGSNVGYGSVASNLGLTRGGGASGGWQTASNWGQLLGRFSGDPEMYTQAI